MAAASLSLMPVIMPALTDAPALALGLKRLLTHTHAHAVASAHTGPDGRTGGCLPSPDAMFDLWLRQRDEENSYVRWRWQRRPAKLRVIHKAEGSRWNYSPAAVLTYRRFLVVYYRDSLWGNDATQSRRKALVRTNCMILFSEKNVIWAPFSTSFAV